MAKKTAKQPSLVEQLKATPQVVTICPLAFLEGEDKKELDAVIEALKAGQLRHLSLNAIRAKVCERFNVKVPKTTFRDFLVKRGFKNMARNAQ